jgi:hypothetical protein
MLGRRGFIDPLARHMRAVRRGPSKNGEGQDQSPLRFLVPLRWVSSPLMKQNGAGDF